MYQKCVDAVDRWFPGIRREETMTLLWGATCYPFGDSEMVARQLQEMHEAGVTTLDGAQAYSEAAMEKAMKEAER